MQILSLNIWHGERYHALKEYLASQLAGTDIFCLQETNGERAQSIINELFDPRLFETFSSTKLTTSNRHYSLQTFIKTTLGPITPESLFDDNPETGQALATRVKLNSSSDIMIINTHGVPFKNDDKLDTEGRIRQSERIIAYLKDSGASSALICGDFNLMPNTKSVELFSAAGYNNLISSNGISTTRNSLAWERFPDTKQLFADYTFTSDKLKVVDFRVPVIEVSDHLPMITVVHPHTSPANPAHD